MQGRRFTVSLCEEDIIVNTEAVGRYLARNGNERPASQDWKHQAWTGEGLDILWFDKLDHAQVFDSRHNRERLVNVIREYSLMDRSMPLYDGESVLRGAGDNYGTI